MVTGILLEKAKVGLQARLRDALMSMERSTLGIILIVDEDGRLRHVATDGDLRRAVLAETSLETRLGDWAPHHTGTQGVPVTAPADASDAELIHLMRERGVEQIPLLDDDGRPVRIARLADFATEPVATQSVRALVMAGGLGRRLNSLTHNMPKPMLPVGDRPLMEHIVRQLGDAGVRHVSVSTHYLPEPIENYFGDGEDFGVSIDYVREGDPLGTAGAIGLMPALESPLLVMNGDILTRIDLASFAGFHKRQEAMMTVAVRRYEFQVPYGVVESDGVLLRGIREKPSQSFFVSAGIYLIEPSVQKYITPGQRLDMTDLIAKLLERGDKIAIFPVLEYWLDIGQPQDYERALSDAASMTGS